MADMSEYAREILKNSTIRDANAYRIAPDRIRIDWTIDLPGKGVTPKQTSWKINPRTREDAKNHAAWDEAVASLKNRAYEKADKLWREALDDLAHENGERVWHHDDLMRDYIGGIEYANDKARTLLARDGGGKVIRHGVSAKEILDDTDIKDSSRRRYLSLLRILHDAVGKDKISKYTTVKEYRRNVRELLGRVETEHGTSTMIHARTVMNRYVYYPMIDDGLIDASPLDDKRLKLNSHGVNKGTSRRATSEGSGDVLVVSPEDRARCIEWMLADPCEAKPGRRGGLSVEESAYRRRELVDLTLLQATMGLRLRECLTLTAVRVTTDKDGYAVVEVTNDVSKTGRGRKVASFDARWGRIVSDRLLKRVDGLEAGAPVFPGCKDHAKFWGEDGARDCLRRYYDEMAAALDVPVLKVRLTHVWRSSLNTEYANLNACGLSGMDADTRTALFGHSKRVEDEYYTAKITPEQQRARARRPGIVATGPVGADDGLRLVAGA